MKRIFVVTILIVGLTAVYSFAQMHGGGMMGQQEGMMGNQDQHESREKSEDNHPCPKMMGPGMMGHGGYGMMGPGMMRGMMGPGMMGMMSPGMMGYGGYGMMGPGMMGYGMGRGMWGGRYSPETYQKYMDETVKLRKELHNKRFDYFEALRKGNTKPDDLRKLEKEIWDLQWEIYKKAPR